MLKMTIPKEYILDTPAFYDEIRLKAHFNACLTVTSFNKMYENGSKLFDSFFKDDTEHAQIAIDLLRYVKDTDNRASQSILVKRFFMALFEAGFFG